MFPPAAIIGGAYRIRVGAVRAAIGGLKAKARWRHDDGSGQPTGGMRHCWAMLPGVQFSMVAALPEPLSVRQRLAM
ncbi:hypothetical protein GCM10010195_67250 [Kitasatospora griseola]|nr:hypothetical protein GCM10010195_67250 [Kitasatospora griseola]